MPLDSCSGCGFEYDLEQSGLAAASIVEGSLRMGAMLRDPGAEVRLRRVPGQWSPLEYGCHVRDILLTQRERVLLARRERCPSLTPMGRDERAEHDGYSEQDPADVARQLEDSARLFANVLARLGERDWDRTLIYNYPEPTERSLRWVAVHTLHEVRHHRLDMARQLSVSRSFRDPEGSGTPPAPRSRPS
jgi:DinB superfamily